MKTEPDRAPDVPPVAGERTWTPTGAAYDDRDLLAEALRQLYAAANEWRGEPELERALVATREAFARSHWPTRWQANPGGDDETSSSASSQPTRTIFVCPECHLVGEAAAWCYGYPLKHPRRERIPVEVVELSRLRAAEEWLLTDEELDAVIDLCSAGKWVREKAGEAATEEHRRRAALIESASSKLEKVREALASLEQKED